jgi:hypothetical protein
MSKKTRHNKKRNTAFLYEALVRELSKAMLKKQSKRQKMVADALKEHFKKGTELSKELNVYRALLESDNLQKPVAEKLLSEAKRLHATIDKKRLFNEQSALIRFMNKHISKDIYANFVPNYKNLATISQILNDDTSIKRRVLLEGEVVDYLCGTPTKSVENLKPIDDLVYKTFVEKFNEQYSGLLDEQRALLNHFILSFSDNGLALKAYLNEEVGRLKKVIKVGLEQTEIKEDRDMLSSSNKVIEIMGEFAKKPIDEGMVRTVLKVQGLAKEIAGNGS